MTLNKWMIKYTSGVYVTPANGDVPYIFNTRREALHASGKFFDAAPVGVVITVEEAPSTLTLKKNKTAE